MLLRFSCKDSGSIIMFGDIALKLLSLAGVGSEVTGTIAADDITDTLVRLRNQLQFLAEIPETVLVIAQAPEDKDNRESPISLATRAGPLIDMLEQSVKTHEPVMWEPV